MKDKDSILLENLYNQINYIVENDNQYCKECQAILLEAKSTLTPEEKEFETELKKKLPKLSLLSVMADAKTIKSIRDARAGENRYLTGILYIGCQVPSGQCESEGGR
jgi:hypothetical protein